VFREFALLGVVIFSLAVGVILKPQFFDLFSLLLTCGGALTVTYFSYSKKQLKDCALAIRSLFAAPEDSLQAHIAVLRRLTELFCLEGLRGVETQEKHLADGYLKYGVELLVDLHNAESIRARLEVRLAGILGEYEVNRQILLTLGKLLPSFGLIGTLIGMVLLLGNIVTADPKSLPAALGLAVLTTLYGAVAANVLVAPLLARLQSVAVERETKMSMSKDWILMIARGENLTLIDRPKTSLPIRATEGGRYREWEPIALLAHR
jgi:chemotaxis protein MotA